MDNKNIAFVGFMACGKTAVSREIAAALGRRLVSTDELIVERDGRQITKIFEESGEEFFRTLEAEIVEEISSQDGLIIDCGGGVILNQSNVDNLKKNGTLIYLSVSPELVHARTKGRNDRPLLNVDDPLSKIKELLGARKPFYEKADVTIDANNKVIGEVCHEILELLG